MKSPDCVTRSRGMSRLASGVRRARGSTLAGAVLVAGLLFSLPARGDALDTVFLKDGGRMRGTVMVEDPKTGVQIKLPDGTVRSLKPGEVDRVEYSGAAAASPTAPAATASPTAPAPAAAVPPAAVPASLCMLQTVECPCSGETIGKRPCDPATGTLLPCQCPLVRRSTGMMAGGIVMAVAGGIGIGAGLGVGIAWSGEPTRAPSAWPFGGTIIGISSAILIPGIVLSVVGGKKSRAKPEPTATSWTVAPTLNGLVLSGSF